MKQTSFLNRLTKWIVLPLTVLVISFSAQAAAKNLAGDNDNPTTISYVTTTEKGILFNVKHDNAEGSRFRFIIKNEAGDVFYNESFKDRAFDKNIVLAKEPGSAHLIFSIVAPGINYNQSFDISNKQTTVTDVVISKQ